MTGPKKAAFLFCLLILPAVTRPAFAERAVNVGFYDFKPLIFKDRRGNPAGLFIDVLNHVAKKEDWRINYVYGTWADTYGGLLDGKLDLVPCIGITEERKEFVDFTAEYLFLDWGVIYSLPGAGIENILDLKNKRVAALKGSVYTEGLKQTLRQFDIIQNFSEEKTYADVFRLMEQGKVDAGISTSLTGIPFEKDFSARRTPIIFSPVKIAYAVKKNSNGDIVRALNLEVAELKTDKSSIYYDSYNNWIADLHQARVPKHIWWSIGGLLALGTAFALWNIALKGQVKLKTAHLESEIHERRLAEAEIRELNADLERRVAARTAQYEAANKEMEAFAYSVSHDLRAPLRAVDGYTRILVEEYGPRLDDEGRRVCSVISRSARDMGKLIDDLLAFSRVGRPAMQPSVVDMTTLANSIYFELTTAEERERIDFRVGPLPAAVGDPNLLRQVWMNLLSNAVKFTSREERALIQVNAVQNGSEVVYSVRDNGAGFDMKYADKLFGVFQRLHDVKEYEGTGVGLAIVQRIVHRHGGRIWAEGEPGRGAAFHFTLSKG